VDFVKNVFKMPVKTKLLVSLSDAVSFVFCVAELPK